MAQWLGSSNSCINPILYAFFNTKYRRGFMAVIKSRSCCGRLRYLYRNKIFFKKYIKLNKFFCRYYDTTIVASSTTTSTRKSSQYQGGAKRGPNSPSTKSSNFSTCSFDYSTASLYKKHNIVMKQDSNLSQQLLLKHQDSSGSRQMLIKQESVSSDGSRRMLLKHQDSCDSRSTLSNQDSVISYIETKRGQLVQQDSDLSKRDSFSTYTQDSISIDSRRGILCKQDTQISIVDQNQHCNRNSCPPLPPSQLIQDNTNSPLSAFEQRRKKLTKQDSVISFADQKPGEFFSFVILK